MSVLAEIGERDLASCEFLDGYYSPERLDSERARRQFVLPERLP